MRQRLIVGLYLLLTLGPLLLGLGYSLAYSLGLVGLLSEGFTLVYWQKWWQSGDALWSLGYSLLLTATSLALVIGLALAFSWGFRKKRPSQTGYGLLLIPMLFPPLVAAFAWYQVLSPSGWLSRMAYSAGLTNGIEDFPRLVNDVGSIGILWVHVFLVFPLFTLVFMELSRKWQMEALLQTARTLGSRPGGFFLRIYCPVLCLKALPLIGLYGLFLFGTYEVPLLLGRSSPRVVTVFIVEKMERYNLQDIPVGYAMATMYTLLVLALVVWWMPRKMHRWI